LGGLKKPAGLDLRCGRRFTRFPDSYGSPESAEMRPLVKAPLGTVPRSARNWIAVNAVQQFNPNKNKRKNMKTLSLTKSAGRSPWRSGGILIVVALACFALSAAPKAFGGLPPPAPDGGYPNQTTAEGTGALFNLTSGTNNTALGFDALFNDTTGGWNTATGEQTLYLNVAGNYNTGNGYRALYSNTGSKNTADGFRALFSNTGDQNTAAGFQALYFNTTGDSNTAVGHDALYHNTIGTGNTASGYLALFNNTTGSGNVAIGFRALSSNTTQGVDTSDGTSVAIGYQALENNVVEDNNAVGHQALQNNTTGLFNNAFGWHALISNLTGDSNTAIGDFAGANITGNGNVCIGAGVGGVPGENNTTRIKNIVNTPFTTGGFFLYEVNGAIGVFTSSRKFKDDIKPIDKASETIYSLSPVTFRAKPLADPSRPRGYGLIAEDVEKVNPDLVSHGQNDILTVRYESINAMMLNEFLKEHKKVEEQQATIAQLKKDLLATSAQQQEEIKALTATLKEQAKQIERVNALVTGTKPAPQLAGNN
jgi:Chaperone of endosialidase